MSQHKPSNSFTALVAGAVLAAAASACVVGPPPGYPDRDSFTIPLLGAMRDGTPIAPVTINGEGPYLFYLNLDAHTVVDRQLADSLGLILERSNTKLVDSADTISHEQLFYADTKTIGAGDLTVRSQTVAVLPFQDDYRGRPVLGVIGSDVIAETMVWTLDRDRLVFRLESQKTAEVPADAAKVSCDLRHGQLYTKIHTGGGKAYVRVQMTGRSALWPKVARKLNLEPVDSFSDPFGRHFRATDQAWRVAPLEVGGASVEQHHVSAFRDKRVREVDFDGVLGQDFLARFNLIVNFHKENLYLLPRVARDSELTAERVARWGATMTNCSNPACLSVAATEDGFVFSRGALSDEVVYEVTLEAVDAEGYALELPRVVVVLPNGTMQVAMQAASFGGTFREAAGFRAIDASPFPARCDSVDGCVLLRE